MEKAYDRTYCKFLERVLRVEGIEEHFIKLIAFGITSATLLVLWNGEAPDCFQPSRGLCQGDPQSPYLFFLCMEILGNMIQKSAAAGQWKGLKFTREGPMVSHTFFADDLILFGEATERQDGIMAGILEYFVQSRDRR